MGNKISIPVNHITERMLPPHLRRRPKTIKNTNIITSKFDSTIYDEYTAGEAITAGNAVHIAADGLAYKADNTASKSAIGFAAADAAVNGKVYLQTSRQIVVSSAGFAVGQKVFLSTGSINISTNIQGLANNNLVQRLGTAISSDIIQINIEEVKKVIL
jgi:hypothetical protein